MPEIKPLNVGNNEWLCWDECPQAIDHSYSHCLCEIDGEYRRHANDVIGDHAPHLCPHHYRQLKEPYVCQGCAEYSLEREDLRATIEEKDAEIAEARELFEECESQIQTALNKGLQTDTLSEKWMHQDTFRLTRERIRTWLAEDGEE